MRVIVCSQDVFFDLILGFTSDCGLNGQLVRRICLAYGIAVNVVSYVEFVGMDVWCVGCLRGIRLLHKVGCD